MNSTTLINIKKMYSTESTVIQDDI